MSIKRIVAATALICFTSVAVAKAGPWVRTSSGPDSDETGTSLHTEYVLQNSISPIRGNYREAYVKITYAPGVPLMGGDVVTTQIADVMVGCGDLSWGDVSDMAFDNNMRPILATVGEFDKSKPAWVIKDMQALSPASITYRTAQYICAH
jgi:hypothetical protein